MTVHEVLSRLPDPVAERLAAHRLDAERLAPVLDWPADAAVLLAGSFAESMQTSASDLDFLVLREDGPGVRHLGTERGLAGVDIQTSTLVDRILAPIGGVEFDVLLLTRVRMAELAGALRTSVDADGTIRSLPVLRYLEDKLLCRLYDGVVLQNDAVVADWRRDLRLDHFPALLTAGLISDTLSLLEDAVTMPLPRSKGGLDTPFGGMIAARSAAERLVRAAVTATGTVGWDLRYATLYRDRLAATDAEVPAALAAVEELLFPARPGADGSTRADLDTYIRVIAAHVRPLIDGLDGRPGMGAALQFLRAFGRDRWSIDHDLIDLSEGSR